MFWLQSLFKEYLPVNLIRRTFFTLSALALWSSFASTASAQAPVTVVEYQSTASGLYFITGRPSEQTLLDGLPTLWTRTGMQFQTLAGVVGVAPEVVCRYRIQIPGASYSTHFYGTTSDCALVAAQNRPDAYIPEGLDFGVVMPTNGTCPASAPVGIYRTYQSVSPVNVPNHRYSVNLAGYNEMILRKFAPENLVFCVQSATPPTPRPTFANSATKRNFCEAPRTGLNPSTGQAYPDVQGTRANEKEWIRSWVDESYLWYREVPNATTNAGETVQTYFGKLKTPYIAASGGAKDRFSFQTTTASVDNTNAGITFGYGVKWSAIKSSPPREWIAAVIDPGSPAALAGVARGDKIVSVDGVDFVSGNDVNTINRGLFPPAVGESHGFVLQPANGSAQKSVTLTSASLPLISVPVSGVINTATGKVGYIAFTTFNSFTSEKAIADAIAGLAGQGINDLVLDLRYNGGGYIYISSQLAYMVAGGARTAGKVFEATLTNDKKPFGPDDFYPFYNVGSGFAGGVASGQALPTLNLSRVFVLTTGGSCSASESFINSLRGLDIPVILIGNTTCGKPYGFSGRDNCGTTYYPIQFTGVNQKGEGDFVNGFAPTCTANDDLTKPLGDSTERQLATALSYRANGACPAGTALSEQKSAVSVNEENPTDAVGAQQRALGQLKLTTPTDVPRGAGGAVTPRAPQDLGEIKQPATRTQ
jgi:carboxyl-terminal processing protease